MSAAIGNPLLTEPSLAAALETVRRQPAGQWLAVYAVARRRDPLPDPLAALGLPLLDLVVRSLDDAPERVAAIHLGGAGGLAQWSLLVAFASGLKATVDVGAGFGPAQAGPLDLRVEWSGTETTVLAEPAAVAVTVLGPDGADARSAEVAPVAEALAAFAESVADFPDDSAWKTARRVVLAARQSAERGEPVVIDR